MADLTPEHTKRNSDSDDSDSMRDLCAAYAYVSSVLSTADAISPCGGYAWHGWALREAYLAGCSYAREVKG
jgi:hypothetical protein